MTVEKIAISLPAETLTRLEEVRARLGKSRSAIIGEALRAWLDEREPTEDDRRYVESYLRHPEPTDETAAIAARVVASWETWE